MTRLSLICLLVTAATAETPTDDGLIRISMNKVWPRSNPIETYRYYDLPFCQPDVIMPQMMSFSQSENLIFQSHDLQAMRGDRLVNSVYEAHWRRDVTRTTACEKKFTKDEISQLKAAIDKEYMYLHCTVEGLPVTVPLGMTSVETFVGDVNVPKRRRYFLMNYLDFVIGYDGDNIVAANVSTDFHIDHLVELADRAGNETVIPFTYSVRWISSSILGTEATEQQQAKVVSEKYENTDIHLLAIINSIALILLMTTSVILTVARIVKSDLSRYLSLAEDDLEDENGWKLIHGDVFRTPPHRIVFAAGLGAGIQLLLAMMFAVLVGCIGIYYDRGTVMNSAAFSYSLTAFAGCLSSAFKHSIVPASSSAFRLKCIARLYSGGFVTGKTYHTLGGERWAWSLVLTAVAFAAPAFGSWMVLNTIAIAYNSTAAWPFHTIISVIILWASVTFPLTVLGGVIGRRIGVRQITLHGKISFPCKTNKLPRPIPPAAWYSGAPIQLICSGFLSFSAVYIELHYVFASVWGSMMYTLYGVLLVSCCLLFVMSASVTILFTYIHLNAEDYRWWWRSSLSGLGTAVFFYLYCLYYYYLSDMSGWLQSSFFFVYSLLVAYALTLIVGAVNFGATYYFVTYIYSRIKID